MICFSNLFDKVCYAIYVVVVLYLFNPVAIAMVICIISSPTTVAIFTVQVFHLLLIVGCMILYHYTVWLKIRKKFLRYEGIYFNIFIPGVIERRNSNVNVTHDKRKHGDTSNGKSED